MADFKLVLELPDATLPVGEADLIAFRFYERLSGMDPTLDLDKADLRGFSPEDDSPPSPFEIASVRHAPPVLNHETRVQPPYYLRAIFSPSVLPDGTGPDDLLGCPASLVLSDDTGPDTRHVRGLVLRTLNRQGSFTRAHAVEVHVYPWIWAFALSAKSRVWLDLDSVGLLRDLVGEYQDELGDTPAVVQRHLSATPRARESVIQWDESDFEFLSRLLERDGLYYFFSHDDRQTKIVLADSRSAYAAEYLPQRALSTHPTLGPGSELFDDHVSFLTTQSQTLPRRYHVADYNPVQALTGLDYGVPSEARTALEIYDYPAEVSALSGAPDAAGRRFAAVSARRRVIYAASRCPFVSAGHATTLPDPDQDGDPAPVRVLQAVHELVRDAEGKPHYRNWFEAIDGATPYAPTQRTPIPAVHGTHNAVVVTSLPGETVDVDVHSRALVIFRWDRARTPVRVRLGQPWAGRNHGMHILPRVGDEVLVGFIQGNTERPIILTSLHNSHTPKKFNPTIMEPHGLQNDTAPGPERQNRYATVLHNTQGNAIYFNDSDTDELIKIDAYKNFVLEIGHKTSYTPEHSSHIEDTSIAPATKPDGSEESLEEFALDEPTEADSAFEADKTKRGGGLIRSYGDLTVYVGKFRQTMDEYPAGDHQKEAGVSEGDDLAQEDRGSFNLYVMGGTTKTVRGSFAYVKHPKDDAFVSAEYNSSDSVFGRVKASASQGKSASMHEGVSTGITAAMSASLGVGLNNSINLGGGLSLSASSPVSSGLSLTGITMSNLKNAKVDGIFGKLEATGSTESINASKVILASDCTLAAADKGWKSKLATKTLMVETAAAAVAATATAVVTGLGKSNIDDSEDTKDFLSNDLIKLSDGLQVALAALYGLGLAVAAGFLAQRALATKTSHKFVPTITIDPKSVKLETPTTSIEMEAGQITTSAMTSVNESEAQYRNAFVIEDSATFIEQIHGF